MVFWFSGTNNQMNSLIWFSDGHTYKLVPFAGYLLIYGPRSKLRYDIFHKTTNKGADYTVGMCRLVCAFVVRKPPKKVFLASTPKYEPQHVISNNVAFC